MSTEIILWVAAILLGMFNGVLSWNARTLYNRLVKLEDNLQKLTVKVAEDYVTKDENQGMMNRIMEHLQRIEDKLDRKIDKT